MNLNKVILIGRAGRNGEQIANGKGLKFSLAISDNYKNDAGEWVENTTWLDVVAWGKLADNYTGKIEKGGIVMVEGKIKIRKWQSPETGEKKYYTEIHAHSLQRVKTTTTTPPAESGDNSGGNDDLPF